MFAIEHLQVVQIYRNSTVSLSNMLLLVSLHEID